MKKNLPHETILSQGENKRIVRERCYKAGYIIRDEYWPSNFEDKPEGHSILMKKIAYNHEGEYIGNSKRAYFLLVKKGIIPKKSHPDHCVCSIGFCKKNFTWYGWSHRAMQNFGIGDKLFDENWYPEGGTGERDDCGFLIECEKIPFIKRGTITIRDMEQAKQAAVNFADYIS